MRPVAQLLRHRSARLGALCALVFTFVMVQAAWGVGLAALDAPVSSALYAPEGAARAGSVAAAVFADNRVMLPIVGVVAFLLHRKGRTPEAFALLGLLVTTQLLVHGLKAAFDLPRPEHAFVPTSGAGFPSGHAANGALAGVALGWFLRRRVAVALGLAWMAFIAWGRMGGGAHFLTDVLGGASLGAGLALVVLPAASRIGARRVPVSVPVPVAAAPARSEEAVSRTEEVP